MALHSGRPLTRSHNTTVSRWLAMPMAAISAAVTPAAAIAAIATPACDDQISSASCSTQPACG